VVTIVTDKVGTGQEAVQAPSVKAVIEMIFTRIEKILLMK
jgi:hypothetical protein